MKFLITGMSGTGTSSVLEGLSRHGWDVVDTDYGPWKIRDADGDMIWDETRMDRLLSRASNTRHLAVDGCVSNQGTFYDRFDVVVLLTAPIDVMLDRVIRRTNNDYGKTEAEQDEIRANTELVEPLLRANADVVIDTSVSTIDDIVHRLIAMASRPSRLCACGERPGCDDRFA